MKAKITVTLKEKDAALWQKVAEMATTYHCSGDGKWTSTGEGKEKQRLLRFIIGQFCRAVLKNGYIPEIPMVDVRRETSEECAERCDWPELLGRTSRAAKEQKSETPIRFHATPEFRRALLYFTKRNIPKGSESSAAMWLCAHALMNPEIAERWFEKFCAYCESEAIEKQWDFINSKLKAEKRYKRVKLPA